MMSHTPPTFAVPAGACDCHMHVFGPHERYPLSPMRSYTPREASVGDYRAMAEQLGLQRVVFVQPSTYGGDNRCMIDAMRSFGEQARGVAVIDEATNDDELSALQAACVRGVRVNIESFGQRLPIETRCMLEAIARRCAPMGWHIQLFAALKVIADLGPFLGNLGIPIVLDHFGLACAALGTSQRGFDRLVDLVAAGVWVKLSGVYRISDQAPLFDDAVVLARALIEANPGRIVWGSDWPHTGNHAGHGSGRAPIVEFRTLDDGKLLSCLAAWAEEPTLRRILVDNPAKLYGFGSLK